MTCIKGKALPAASVVATPICCSASRVLGLWSLVKIVLNALPIFAPPLAVICWAAVTTAMVSFNETLADSAELATRLIASARSAELTANAASTAAILSTTSVVVNASLRKELSAAVKATTEAVRSSPDKRLKTMASLVLCRVSAALKPCLENSAAASAAAPKAVLAADATSNNEAEKLPNWLLFKPSRILISVRACSTFTVSSTSFLNALWTE